MASLELARASLLTALGLAARELTITEAAWRGLKPSIKLTDPLLRSFHKLLALPCFGLVSGLEC